MSPKAMEVDMESMELEVRVVKPSPLPFQMILAAGWTQFVTVPQNSEPSLDIATIYRQIYTSKVLYTLERSCSAKSLSTVSDLYRLPPN